MSWNEPSLPPVHPSHTQKTVSLLHIQSALYLNAPGETTACKINGMKLYAVWSAKLQKLTLSYCWLFERLSENCLFQIGLVHVEFEEVVQLGMLLIWNC